MKLFRLCAVVLLAAGLSACASVETPTRGEPVGASVITPSLSARSAEWNVVDVRVNVPETLSTTEANMFYPNANIIWRGEPYANRHVQVAALMDNAMTIGLAHLNGQQDVFFQIDVRRFHSVTEKARAFTGGVHDMIFTLTVIDAQTGKALHGPVYMETFLKAHGGKAALQAERNGFSQKVRLTNHLAVLMQQSFPNEALRQAMVANR